MNRPAFQIASFGKRLTHALASGALAFVNIGAFTEGPLAWGTWALWAFSAFVAALGFYLYGKLD